ncbi:MAG TPA: DUF4328 domain-containing protein [Blastocatellia bacterium]|nr:DUF4328 domain-containing protein [Blastocatellia bacterium]
MSGDGVVGPYAPSRPRANLLMAFLAVNVVVQAAAIASAFMHIDLLYKLMSYGIIEQLSPAARAQQHASEARETLMRVIQLAAFAASAVVFLFWLHRAYKNLKPLGAEPRRSPGWAVGAFLVPMVNLFLPFLVAQETWRASDPETVDAKGAKALNIVVEDSSKSLLVVVWWGLWLLTVINVVVAYRWHAGRQVLNDDTIASWLVITLGLLLAVNSAVTMILVRKMASRQDERNRRLMELAAPPNSMTPRAGKG